MCAPTASACERMRGIGGRYVCLGAWELARACACALMCISAHALPARARSAQPGQPSCRSNRTRSSRAPASARRARAIARAIARAGLGRRIHTMHTVQQRVRAAPLCGKAGKARRAQRPHPSRASFRRDMGSRESTRRRGGTDGRPPGRQRGVAGKAAAGTYDALDDHAQHCEDSLLPRERKPPGEWVGE
jgi:hypothetical protein